MARDLSTDVENAKNQETNKPVELYLVHLNQETLYLTDFEKDIDFFDEYGNPQTYTAYSISRSDISGNIDTKIDKCRVDIDNVDLSMSGFVEYSQFVGREMEVWKVFRDNLSSFDNKIVMFKGEMDAPQISQYSISVDVVSELDKLDIRLPKGEFQVKCRFDFGDNRCGKTVPVESTIIQSISGTDITVDAYVEPYYKNGTIEVGHEVRTIEDTRSDAVIVDYPFRQASSGQSALLTAGCNKTYDEGYGCDFWENTEHYGGFIKIPGIRDVRNDG